MTWATIVLFGLVLWFGWRNEQLEKRPVDFFGYTIDRYPTDLNKPWEGGNGMKGLNRTPEKLI